LCIILFIAPPRAWRNEDIVMAGLGVPSESFIILHLDAAGRAPDIKNQHSRKPARAGGGTARLRSANSGAAGWIGVKSVGPVPEAAYPTPVIFL
jgi:hypothetical protein